MKTKHLKDPEPLPQVDGVAAREWAMGWWAGIIVGAVNGVSLGILLQGWLR